MGRKKSASSHILLRLARTTTTLSDSRIDVLEAHNSVVVQHGKCVVAKHGRPISKCRLQLLRDQIAHGTNTFLILCFRKANKFEAFAAPVSEIVEQKDQVSAPAPEYYDSLYDFGPSCWFAVCDIFKPVSLDNITMTKGGRPVAEVLSECRTSAMLVTANTIRFGVR